MRTTHLIILTMAAVSLMGCNPKETVNALTSDQNVTQKMAVRFAEIWLACHALWSFQMPEKRLRATKSPSRER